MSDPLKKIQKICRAVKIFVYLLMAGVAAIFVCTLYNTIFNAIARAAFTDGAFTLISIFNLVFYVGAFMIFFMLSRLMRSIEQHPSPFTMQNVRRLKTIALLTVGIELWDILLTVILSRMVMYSPDADSFGINLMEKEYVANAMGGLILVIGLVVYCIALVFEYGVLLQTQADETL